MRGFEITYIIYRDVNELLYRRIIVQVQIFFILRDDSPFSHPRRIDANIYKNVGTKKLNRLTSGRYEWYSVRI